MGNSDYPDEALRRSALNSLRTRALEALKDTGKGSAARGVLSILALTTTSVSSTEVSNSRVEDPYRRFLVAPERNSVGEFAPKTNWPPRVEYSIHLTEKKAVIETQSSFLAFGGSATAKVPVEELSEVSPDVLPEECFTELASRIDEINETAASQPEEARLPWIHARKERAIERKDELKQRAEKLLVQARSVLLAWALVALVDEGSVSPNKVLSTNRDFVSEAQKLWKKISRRHPDDLSMTKIGDSAGVPTPVSEATEYAAKAIREELTAIDEKILPHRVEAAACTVVEDRIIGDRLEFYHTPTSAEQPPWTGRETTQYAVDLLDAYSEDPQPVQNTTSDMEDLLEEAGYPSGDVGKRLRSIKRALKKDWEDGKALDFVCALANALIEVGELPEDTRMTLPDTVMDKVE